jgi:dynactin complex subunit
VGNTDGMIDGQRYFTTNLHCGIFVKKEDTIKV